MCDDRRFRGKYGGPYLCPNSLNEAFNSVDRILLFRILQRWHYFKLLTKSVLTSLMSYLLNVGPNF